MVYVYDGDRWDHHAGIFDKSAEWNHYRTCTRLDKGLVSLMRRPERRCPGTAPGKTMLDETLIVAQSEFGRTPGMNPVAGRDHYKGAYAGLYVGGGVAGGRVLGAHRRRRQQVPRHRLDATRASRSWTTPSRPSTRRSASTGRSRSPTRRRAVRIIYVDTVNLGGAAMMESDEIAGLFA